MVTATREKKPRAVPLTPEQRESVTSELRAMDLNALVSKMKVTELRERIQKKLGFLISSREFKELREQSCEWFRLRKHGRTLQGTDGLSDDGWVRLRAAVKKLLPELQGRSIKQAVAIVSTLVPTNEVMLNGLTSEYKVWNQK